MDVSLGLEAMLISLSYHSVVPMYEGGMGGTVRKVRGTVLYSYVTYGRLIVHQTNTTSLYESRYREPESKPLASIPRDLSLLRLLAKA